MKILKIVVNGLPHVKDELNIDFVAQQRVDTYDKEHLFNVFFNIRISRKLILTKQQASTQAVAQSTAYDGYQPRHEQPGEPKAS